MRIVIACFGLVVTLIVSPATAAIIAGPINNPANGHDYYLLSQDTWTASEAEAERLGGTLAIIKNVGDQEWVFATFGAYGGTNRNLWLGMHRSYPGGPMTWVTDTRISYLNWDQGQPDNAGGNECYVQMLCKLGSRTGGTWNDLADSTSVDGQPICGVVEVSGKPDSEALTEKDKSLIGTWYASGDHNHPCWISGTGDKLFQIFDNRAARLVCTLEGPVLVLTPQHGIYGELTGDKIVWSNGTWWSREPLAFGQTAKMK